MRANINLPSLAVARCDAPVRTQQCVHRPDASS
jgi:hypothetical protein